MLKELIILQGLFFGDERGKIKSMPDWPNLICFRSSRWRTDVWIGFVFCSSSFFWRNGKQLLERKTRAVSSDKSKKQHVVWCCSHPLSPCEERKASQYVSSHIESFRGKFLYSLIASIRRSITSVRYRNFK